jgi:putative pyruvate formate lyase activating enzyme
VDIYMPDFKFWDPAVAKELAAAEDYPEVARAALREMHRQVGDLELDERGIALRGLLVRHLVMPDGLAGTEDVMRFLAEEVSPQTLVNVMPQYHPEGKARQHAPLRRGITLDEYRDALATARRYGLRINPR